MFGERKGHLGLTAGTGFWSLRRLAYWTGRKGRCYCVRELRSRDTYTGVWCSFLHGRFVRGHDLAFGGCGFSIQGGHTYHYRYILDSWLSILVFFFVWGGGGGGGAWAATLALTVSSSFSLIPLPPRLGVGEVWFGRRSRVTNLLQDGDWGDNG
ncbi:hypothetical protein VTG60DRAFT_7083 [Thermothelomyces hinnuleus]